MWQVMVGCGRLSVILVKLIFEFSQTTCWIFRVDFRHRKCYGIPMMRFGMTIAIPFQIAASS
jgi:hypothetical protein